MEIFYGHALATINSPDRDYFILSKGHGSAALYVVLEKYGFISAEDMAGKSQAGGILGGHPDTTKVSGVEASTGSLGHGVVTAMGAALGLRIQGRDNRVVALIGDGESNEGTVWEMALVAANLKLGNLCVILDMNKSTDQILLMPEVEDKWRSFGWRVLEMDGHDEAQIKRTLESVRFRSVGKPTIIIADTVKGKGVSFMEVHGPWHHRIPNDEEMSLIREELK